MERSIFMKKTTLIITVFVLCISLLAGCGGANSTMPGISLSSASPEEMVSSMPAELLALRFDDYETMSISEYREKARGVIEENEAQYLPLIERVRSDNEIQEMQHTNADAYFIANILIPTIAEKWNTWSFSASFTSEVYMAEYTISYSILNADNITMKERNRAIAAIRDGIQEVLGSRTDGQLTDEAETQAALDNKIKELTEKYSSNSFQLETDLSYRADTIISPAPSDGQADMEERGDIGTEADYQLLLSLKTNGYKNLPVSDFLQSYTDLVQSADFQEACTRVLRDIACDDVRVTVTDDGMSFLETTLEATSQEFVAKYQDGYELPTLRYRIEKRRNETVNGQDILVFELFVDYCIDYSILDGGLTVGERDTVLISIKNGVQGFIDSLTEDELINGQTALEAKIKNLEQQYSNNKMQLNINTISYRASDQYEDIQALQ